MRALTLLKALIKDKTLFIAQGRLCTVDEMYGQEHRGKITAEQSVALWNKRLSNDIFGPRGKCCVKDCRQQSIGQHIMIREKGKQRERYMFCEKHYQNIITINKTAEQL